MKNAFDIAKEICSIPTYEGWDVPRHVDKIDTPRIEFIESFLNEHSIQNYSKMYQEDDGNIKNIYVPFILNPNLETILITAHHDILNSSSMNYNDNTSSLALLLNWCRKFEMTKNVFVAFTDNEERGMRGIKKVFQDVDDHLNFFMHIDVDTCGIGNIMLYDEYNMEFENNFIISNIRDNYKGNMKLKSYRLPYNQAMYSNSHFDVDSLCLTRAPIDSDDNLDLDIWQKIHTIDDVLLSKYEDDFKNFEESFDQLIQSISC